MNFKIKNSILIISTFLILTGCDFNSLKFPLKNSIDGTVQIYITDYITSHFSDIKITFKRDDKYEIITYTGIDGNFRIDKLESRTYKIIIEKEKLGILKIYNYQFLGDDSIVGLNFNVCEIPAGYINFSGTPTYLESKIVQFTKDETNLTEFFQTKLRVFYSNQNNVSAENYVNYIDFNLTENIIFDFNRDFYPFNLNAGETIYFRNYLINSYDNGFFEYETEKTIFSSLNISQPSNIYSFILN